MNLRRLAVRIVAVAAVLPPVFLHAAPRHRWVLSANENKLDLATGTQRMVPNPAPDNLTLLDFASFPPRVREIPNVPNTVLGPPSNVAFSPDQRHVAIANSIIPDASRTNGWRPGRSIHVLDLSQDPPVLATFEGQGLQPSGLCFSPSGRHLVAADRAGGTVSLLRLEEGRLTPGHSLPIAMNEPA